MSQIAWMRASAFLWGLVFVGAGTAAPDYQRHDQNKADHECGFETREIALDPDCYSISQVIVSRVLVQLVKNEQLGAFALRLTLPWATPSRAGSVVIGKAG